MTECGCLSCAIRRTIFDHAQEYGEDVPGVGGRGLDANEVFHALATTFGEVLAQVSVLEDRVTALRRVVNTATTVANALMKDGGDQARVAVH